MNIFVLDKDPIKSAQLQKDRHVIKMCLESCQLLCNCFDQDKVPYKRTHYNHPCSKWVRESEENFNWLKQHAIALCEEYTFRYGKVHKCRQVIDTLPEFKCNNKQMTKFALAMPEQYKEEDEVKSYINYYTNEKLINSKWKNREIPEIFRQVID